MRTKSAARVRKQAKVDANGDRAAGGEAHAGADHDLLGDEVLIETIRVRLLEPVAERRVLDIGVERDHARVDAAERRQRGAPRFARRDQLARLVGRCRHLRVVWRRRRTGLRRAAAESLEASRHRTSCCSQLGDRVVGLLPFLERLAVPARPCPRSTRQPVALERPRQDHRRMTLRRRVPRQTRAAVPGCRDRRQPSCASRTRSSARRSLPSRWSNCVAWL